VSHGETAMGLVRSLQVGTFQTNVPQNDGSRVDFFQVQIETGVRTCRRSYVVSDLFIIRAEIFNTFQIAMEVEDDIRDSATAFLSDEARNALPSKTKRRVFFLSSVVHDCW
jgi:hypothetical protein